MLLGSSYLIQPLMSKNLKISNLIIERKKVHSSDICQNIPTNPSWMICALKKTLSHQIKVSNDKSLETEKDMAYMCMR